MDFVAMFLDTLFIEITIVALYMIFRSQWVFCVRIAMLYDNYEEYKQLVPFDNMVADNVFCFDLSKFKKATDNGEME